MYEPSKHLDTFFVAGFQHYDGALALDRIKVGSQVELVPEPDNPYDCNAIELRFDDVKLGYVPAGKNEMIALMAFYGHADAFEARVLQVDPSVDPWEQVRVGIYVKDARGEA